jgi:hypothetical protein
MARLKMGMVGGGLDALVGAWHRRAVAIDGGIELVAGALASTRERALAAARAWNLPRAYASWEQMLEEESRRHKEERTPTELELDFPNAADGVRGLAFIAAVVDSNASDTKWTAMKKYLSASADN